MPLIDDVVVWAQERPWWQQKLLAQLATGNGVSAQDCVAIAEQLLAGEPDILAEGWLGSLQLPAEASGDAVSVRAIREVENVNRLVGGQALTFDPTGITVVYGYNGSGKSGYARILQQLVRTRHKAEVLPDVFSRQQTSQACTVDYMVGAAQLTASIGDEGSTALQRISFYDEKCGDTYITTESEVVFRPSGLALMDQLYEACQSVRDHLDSLLTKDRARLPLQQCSADSPSGVFLQQLSARTTDDEIAAICTEPEAAEEIMNDLRREEGNLLATDPRAERERLNKLENAGIKLETHLRDIDRMLGVIEQQRLQEFRSRAVDARAAATIASSTSFESEPLSGVGSTTWRLLWEAAKRFSTEEAYPDRQFPVTESSAHCVLCQQPIADQAARRLQAFHAFMTDTTAQTADHAEREYQQLLKAVQEVDALPVEVGVSLAALESQQGELVTWVRDALSTYTARQEALVGGTDDCPPPPNQVSDIASTLSSVAAQFKAAASAVDDGDVAERLATCRASQRDLTDRLALANGRDQVKAERDRLQRIAAVEHAKRGTSLKGVTDKIGDLTRRYVTRAAQDRFSRESDRLGVEKVALQDKRGRQGALLHKPDFVDATVPASLSAVLSEGEQTALGLAGYFTEAYLDPTKSALILDDPLTSLDHLRRGSVAKRLTEFAADRQVIVFTHDNVFAGMLKKQAEEAEIPFAARSIELRPKDRAPGVCVDGHPWAVKDAKARLGKLRSEVARLRKGIEEWGVDTAEREIASWAGGLSETWERIISQEIADVLVDRSTLEVRVRMMKLVARVSSDDEKEMQESYSRCSQWARRHDKDSSLIYTAPSIDELEAELERVANWYERVRKYKN
jgi:energy-coupling factor transporter ATP-binding protein EcfA2